MSKDSSSPNDLRTTLYRPVDLNHPIHAKIGQMTSLCATIERTLNIIIGEMIKVDENTFSCISSQLPNYTSRIISIKLLLKRRGLDDLSREITELGKKLRHPFGIRNRSVHDATTERYSHGGELYRKEAESEDVTAGLNPVDLKKIDDAIAKLNKRLGDVQSFRQRAVPEFYR